MATAINRRIPLRFLRSLGRHRLSDGELLRRYLTASDEEAFAEIVRRNGPLVLRSCRHVLGETTAAEDAFQATFLLLARKGRNLAPGGSLAGWLHAAAVRIAGDARRAEGRRRRRESAAGRRAEANAMGKELMWREIRERLDAELAALPEKYRLPLVLCYFQELSYEDAARCAGCTPGALRGRLERGKSILRQRLARFGLPLTAPILVLGQPLPVSAALHKATLATIKAAAAGGAIPAAVAVLAGSAISLKSKVASLVVVVLAACGLVWAAQGESSLEAGPTDSPPPLCEAQAAKLEGRGLDGRGDPLPPGAVARLGTRRFQVSTYPFSPVSALEGKAYLVYQPGKGERGRADFRWLDTATGKVVDTWPVPLGPVFDAETGRPTPAVPHQGLAPVSISQNGRWAVFTDARVFFTGIRARQEKPNRSLNLYVYDTTTKKKVKDLRGQLDEAESHDPHGIVSTDGKWLASSGGKVRLWDLTSGKQVWAAKTDAQHLELLGFTPGNKHLVLCGSNDGAIVVVDVARADVVRTIETNVFDRRRGTLLAPDGGTVVMQLVNPRDTLVWDVNAGKQLPSLDGADKKLEAWAFSPDGKMLICAIEAEKLRIVVRDWPSRKVRQEFDLGRPELRSLFISADNRTLNVLFRWENTLHRYDLESGKLLPVPGETHHGRVVGVQAAPDGSIVSLGSDKALRTWDLASGRQTRQAALDIAPAEAPFALSQDGKLVAAADRFLSEVAIFDRNGKLVRRLDTTNQRIDQVVFSPSGRFLAGSGREAKVVRVWETATGKTVADFPAGRGVWWSRTVDFAFSPDERYFVATVDGRVRFWEVDGWRSVEGLSEYVSGIAFSPDGRMLACGSGRDTAIWEVATRKPRTRLKSDGHWNWMQRFSPNDRLLARLTSAEAVEVWDVFRGEQFAAFQGHDSSVKAFAFTRDGKHLITASDDCTLLVWGLAGARADAGAPQKIAAPTEKEVINCWRDLSSPSAEQAFKAIGVLTGAPDRATALMRSLKRPPALDAAKVGRLLDDLNADSFAVRKRATDELKALGDRAEIPLRQFLAGNLPLEARTRADQILEALLRPVTSPERLQQLRGIEVLRHISSQEAREILHRLAKGPSEAALTRDATAGLRGIEAQR